MRFRDPLCARLFALLQPLHPQAHTITVEELTALYAQVRCQHLAAQQLQLEVRAMADAACCVPKV
jgi:hypothetical protein